MRITLPVRAQHIGWTFKKLWEVRREKLIKKTTAEDALRKRNIPIYDAKDFLRPKIETIKLDIIGSTPKPIKFDETHPDWHATPLLMLKDEHVLLDGLTHAKVITNTVEPIDSLLDTIKVSALSENFHNKVQRLCLMGTHIYDAEQKKLPKLKDPNRPAWNFPRVFGVTQDRVNMLTVRRLLQLVEGHCDLKLVRQRTVLDDLFFSYNFEKYQNVIQFEFTGDTVLLSDKPLSPFVTDHSVADALRPPNMFPVEPTITLNPVNIYKRRNIYPISPTMPKHHPHTVFVHFNKEFVKNLYEEEVTDDQIYGRSLLKAFTVAASYARAKFGVDVKNLPMPVTVQCIQTDGRNFHFGIFQLNSLDLNGVKRNYWSHTNPQLPIFDSCCYKESAPHLDNYNPTVVEHLNAFYCNV